MDGGVGDHIGSLVAVNYILKNYPYVNLLVWVPDYLLDFAKNVLPSAAIVRDFTALKTKYDRNRPTITTKWDGITSPMKTHCVDYAFQKLCDEAPSIEHKNYLKVNFTKVDSSMFALPEKYVVIATGFTAKVREFSAEAVNGVAEYCVSKGVTPIFVGQTNTKTGASHEIKGTFSDEVNYKNGINLVNKTTLLEVAKIMQSAKAVVGVDCGLLHIAGCTDAPIVAGFTTVSPELRAPIRNNQLGHNFYPVTPSGLIECRFCQSSTNFLYGHDYRNCLYKDYLCVKDLTASKFIAQLGKLLIQ